jgi:4-hydroxy-tetrahydrodipicolinate synthase
MNVRGVCPIVDTPFTETGEVDYESLRSLVGRLAASECDSVAVFGFASEYYTLTDDERRRMTEVVIDGCAESDTTAIVSITPHAMTVAVEEAEYAERTGADALMVLPPHVRVSSSERVIDHVEAIAEAVSVPVVVQYTPSGAGVQVSPEEFARLSQRVPNVDYFKIEARPPGPYISRLLEETDGEANVLVGNAGREMIEALDRGAVGVMPASSMYEIYLEIYEEHQRGNRDRAMAVHGDLLQMLTVMGQVGIQVEKDILARRGMADTNRCREPVTKPDEYHEDIFDHVYESYIEPHLSERE